MCRCAVSTCCTRAQFPQMDMEHMDFTPLSAPAASLDILGPTSGQPLLTNIEPIATGTATVPLFRPFVAHSSVCVAAGWTL